MFDTNNIRREFPILATKVNQKDLVYLDNAATSQKPQLVIDKVSELHSSCNANIHRGSHYMSNRVTEQYEAAREKVSRFIGAESAKSIVFTSGATASINLIASSYGAFIGKGDHIVVSEMEHHSNIVPWQMLCERTGAVLKVVPFNDKGELDIDAYLEILTPQVKLVAITQASNVLGTMPDIKFIIGAAHERGSRVAIDGCQGVVHGEVNVKDLDCDFYAFSGHKLYGPTGIGVLYAKEELLQIMPPYMGGGDMVAHVAFEKTTYADVPLKFEAGTTNFIGAIALGTAIDYLDSINIKEAHAHENKLLRYATDILSNIDGLTIYGIAESKCPLLSFNIEGIHHYDLALLLDKQGVAVRSGTHCAEPIMKHYSMSGCVRASFAFYNTTSEVDALYKAINVAVKMLK
ncbi:MAG: SufS family cysteine desulfurase [Rikenellaceae bacterium]